MASDKLETDLDSSRLDVAMYGSSHPGVCQFVFGDGSVRALSLTTDKATLGLLAHPTDGQVIPPY